MRKSPAQRAYIRRMLPIMVLYVATIMGAGYASRADLMTRPVTVAAALVAGLCIAGVFWAIGRLIVDEQDEFQRMLVVRQALIATGFSLSIAAIHGFLSSFDLITRIDLYWVAVLWFAGLGVGGLANRLRFGVWGGCA